MSGTEPGPTDESAFPSLESGDPAERIAARRNRRAARTEAKRRQEQGDPGENLEVQAEVRRSLKQVELSKQRLLKLQTDGLELVSNIQVAGDTFESQRRSELREACRLRLQKMEEEVKASQEKFEEVSRRWRTTAELQIPQELSHAVNTQIELCSSIVQDKNTLINELHQELKSSDERYVKDRKRQAEMVELMVVRMEEQIKSLIKAYREELQEIESSFDEEQTCLLEGNLRRWEELLKGQHDKELEAAQERMRRKEEFGSLLQRHRVEGTEQFNDVKEQLETTMQGQQQQLEQNKATFQLNQEKLEYSLQQLKRQDKESSVIKSQQKRQIIRLQDTLNKLKMECTNQEKEKQKVKQMLSENYRQVTQQVRDRQRKMRHFSAVDARHYEEVWRMNEKEIHALVGRALDLDRIIHQQLLGLDWTPPDTPITQHVEPITSRSHTASSALQMAALVLKGEGRESAALETGGGGGVPVKTMKSVLEMLCDEAGFLVERKLSALLAPLEEEERRLVKLNSIFTALGIEHEDEVLQLAEFLTKFPEAEDPGPLHPGDVLPALRVFTARRRSARRVDASGRLNAPFPAFTCTPACRVPAGRDAAATVPQRHAPCWENMADIISQSKLATWNALEKALLKYHSVLQERSRLLAETRKVQQQNTELRMLLHQYTDSKVNAEPAFSSK
ncbi:dynein regulatory complex protein 1 isoform X2 [Denticeps clupeoides]|uniref:dynein regulatory complex protein 1 isoform X2 n=1 Tax=Denticeps clupeoides TaxID=299321 RepID=UPI0010A551D8|nr:dynein regulatory complex protein 1 isoform X2 [Denticeps clupeoides]